MIIVKIRKYVQVEGFEHISTTWKVASDKSMQNVIEVVERSDMVELFYSDIVVPDGVTYYVQATRHFNASNMDYSIEPIPVVNNDQAYNNLLFQEDSYIETPYVSINRDELMNNDQATLTFKTSKFRSTYDKHKATHFLILDHNDKIIFSKMYETENLTALDIPNSYEYRNKTKITFIAIHVGISGMESMPGRKVIYFNRDVNWEFDKNMSRVEPNVDFTVGFIPVDNTTIDIRQVELLHPKTGDIVLRFDQYPITSITIPWDLLPEDVVYNIKVTYIYNGQRVSTIRQLKTANYNNMIIPDEKFIYQNKITPKTLSSFYIPNNIHAEMMYNGNWLLPSNHKKLTLYRWDKVKQKLIKTKNEAKGINLPSSKISDMSIRVLSRAIILIDCYNEENQPTFLLYRYNLKTDDFTLLSSVTREDEKVCTGGSNAVVQTDIKTIYYIPYGTSKLRRYNIDKKTVEDVAVDIPLKNLTKAILIRGRANRLFISNGEDYQACVYNTHTGNLVTGYQFGPVTFLNKPLKVVQLINGNSLIFPTTKIDMSKGCFEYYDLLKGTFIIGKDQFEADHIPNITLVTTSGEIILGISYETLLSSGVLSREFKMYIYY